MTALEIVVYFNDKTTDEERLELIIEEVDQEYAYRAFKHTACVDAFDEDFNAPCDGIGSSFNEGTLEIVQLWFHVVEDFEDFIEEVFDVNDFQHAWLHIAVELDTFLDVWLLTDTEFAHSVTKNFIDHVITDEDSGLLIFEMYFDEENNMTQKVFEQWFEKAFEIRTIIDEISDVLQEFVVLHNAFKEKYIELYSSLNKFVEFNHKEATKAQDLLDHAMWDNEDRWFDEIEYFQQKIEDL